MAGSRVELLLLLLVLTGALLLVSGGEWQEIDPSRLRNYYESWQLGNPHSFPPLETPDSPASSDDDDDGDYDNTGSDYDGGDNTGSDYDGGDNTGSDSDGDDDNTGSDYDDAEQFSDGQPQSVSEPYAPQADNEDWVEGGLEVEYVETYQRGWNGSASENSTVLDVACTDDGFHITLQIPSLHDVTVLGSDDVSLMNIPQSCGYEVDHFQRTLNVPFTGCNVELVAKCNTDSFSLHLSYVDEFGERKFDTAYCETEKGRIDPGLFPRSGGQPKANCETPTGTAQNCAVVSGERVTCGDAAISSTACKKMGCCVDPSTSACYYPLDECTGDQHFVFAIRSNSASIPVDTTKLTIPGHPECKPVIVNDKVGIFKFKVTECGTRAYEVGETKIYLAEVQHIVRALQLKYGIITRSSPLRFMVECRYSKSGGAQTSLASVGYMVKIPSAGLPSDVKSKGLFAVELRIANDATFSSFLPTDHKPLKKLLGAPLYLELRILSPKPEAVIIVNYCIAYPRSAKNALVMVYDGCANPYDKSVTILKVSDLPKNRSKRRFVVKAFQFMDQKTNKYLNEEIYFMCSTEVCLPYEKACRERCFDGKP